MHCTAEEQVECIIGSTIELRMVYFRVNGLYNAIFSRNRIGLVQATRADLNDIMDLHRKLGHAGRNGLGGSVRDYPPLLMTPTSKERVSR